MARMHLGSFGTLREAIDADFDYFGETIRVHPDASDLDHAELMIIAAGIDVGDIDMDDRENWTDEQKAAIQKANEAAVRALQGQVHPEDWERFFKTAKANRQRTMDLMAMSEEIAAAVAGFPTGQQSDSSPGQPNTGRRSKDGSSSRRVRTARKGLQMMQGRPDMQIAVVKAYEAETGSQVG